MQNNTFSTLFVGQNLIKLSNVDSTNNYLKNLASKSEPLPEGTVIMADHQFGGRGQRQNRWISDPGKNLTFSLLLYPHFVPIERQFDLNIVISLAINNVLSRYLPSETVIKWPNDILYHHKKISGILIENAIVGNFIKNTVIGIGINVNQVAFNEDLSHRITSLSQILQQNVNLDSLLEEICTQIEQIYLQLKNGKGDLLKNKYMAQLYRFGETEKYATKDGIFEGKIEGISDTGMLQIKSAQHEMFEFGFKEVAFL